MIKETGEIMTLESIVKVKYVCDICTNTQK